MTQSGRVTTAFLAAMVVSSCGGGSSSPTPTPVATATPTPTPSPTPTFSYTRYDDLRGVQNFGTACFGHAALANGIPDLEGVLNFNAPGLIVQDIASADSWRWDVTSLASGNTASFRHREDLGLDTFIQKAYDTRSSATFPNGLFNVVSPQRNDQTSPALYGRLGYAEIAAASGEPASTTACTWGVGTDPDDVPASTVSYSGLLVIGRVFEPGFGALPKISAIVSGSLNIQRNPTSGVVTISLSYVVEDAFSGVRTTLGPFTGEASVDATNDRIGYSGSLTAGGSPEYQINGAFFGPAGAETGFVATAQVDQDGDGLNERFIEIQGYGLR